MSTVNPGSPFPTFPGQKTAPVHANVSVAASGSTTFAGFATGEVQLFIVVGGGSGTLSYTIQEVDPGNGSTAQGGSAKSGTFTGAGSQKISVPCNGGTLLVSWTVAGGPFTGVYATLAAGNGGVAPHANRSSTGTVPGGVGNYIDVETGGCSTLAFYATGASGLGIQFFGLPIGGSWAASQQLPIMLQGLSASGTPIFQPASAVSTSATAQSGTVACGGHEIIRIYNALSTAFTISYDASAGAPPVQVFAPLDNNGEGNGFNFSSDERLGVSVDTLLFEDNFDSTALHAMLWAASVSVFTQSQASNVLSMNTGGSQAANSYSIITSLPYFPLAPEFTINNRWRARPTFVTNSIIEMGYGAPAGVAAIGDAIFFRWSGTTLYGVINFNGTETTVALGVAATITPNANFGSFDILVIEDEVRFIVETSTGDQAATGVLPAPAGQSAITLKARLPVFARIWNSGGAAATNLEISYVCVGQKDVATNDAWGTQLCVAAQRNGNIDPVSVAQTANLAIGTNPTPATPLNTSIIFSGLGGEFIINATGASANFLGVIGRQNPTAYSLVVTGIHMPAPMVNATLGTGTVTNAVFCLMVSSTSNPSTAAGQRYPLGMFSAPVSAAAGTIFSGQDISKVLTSPIVVPPGWYLIVLVKYLTAPATPAGSIYGQVDIQSHYR